MSNVGELPNGGGSKPKMFVGSSSAGLRLARAIRENLIDAAEITLWNEGIFDLGEAFLEALMKALDVFDFALLVLTPDDVIAAHDGQKRTPRDNVMFELGLFMGRLGRLRTFMVLDSSSDVKLASDLAGITIATFDGRRADANLLAAVAPACDKVRRSIERQGILSINSGRHLEEAAGQVKGTSDRMENLMRSMARSRITELEITEGMFSPLMSSEQMKSIHADLADLRRYTEPG